jgi:hypothetical protein
MNKMNNQLNFEGLNNIRYGSTEVPSATWGLKEVLKKLDKTDCLEKFNNLTPDKQGSIETKTINDICNMINSMSNEIIKKNINNKNININNNITDISHNMDLPEPLRLKTIQEGGLMVGSGKRRRKSKKKKSKRSKKKSKTRRKKSKTRRI